MPGWRRSRTEQARSALSGSSLPVRVISGGIWLAGRVQREVVCGGRLVIDDNAPRTFIPSLQSHSSEELDMFMFLPFLLSLASIVAMMCGRRPHLATWLFFAALIATLASFSHHATDSLNLSF